MPLPFPPTAVGSNAGLGLKRGPWYRPKPQAPAPGVTAFEPVRAMEPALLTGKRGSKALKKAGYEASVPRCDNCTHYRHAQIKLFNSLPVHFPTRCMRHLVRVEPLGCCDAWAGRNGDVLEP